jgi:UDPglucose 6-dehydrogenase
METAAKILENVRFFENPYDAAKNCDALIVATEWDEFRNVDMKALKSLMKKPVIVDGRNIYDPDELKKLGFIYLGIGR